jgi:hypothetical protein
VLHPAWWVIALGAFLVRGGILLALLPIVVLPTPVGIANAIGPALVGFVFGGPSPAFIQLVATVVLAALAWLVGSTIVGAWLDVELASEVALDEEVALGSPFARVAPLRALAVRLMAHIPTAIALAWSSVLIVSATYEELTSPGDAALPIPLRVVLRVPAAVALLGVAWLAGEAFGGAGLRRLAHGESIGRALVNGAVAVVRPSGLATLVLTTVVAVASLVPLVVVAAVAWEKARLLLLDGTDTVAVVLGVVLFLATWLAGLVVAAVGVAFRQDAWTIEVGHRSGVGRGTMEPPPG